MTNNTWTDERRAEVQDTANRYHLADLDPESFAEFIEWYNALSDVEKDWLNPMMASLRTKIRERRDRIREKARREWPLLFHAVEMEADGPLTVNPSR